MSGPRVTALDVDTLALTGWPYDRRLDIRAVPGARWDPSGRQWLVPVRSADALRHVVEDASGDATPTHDAADRLSRALAASSLKALDVQEVQLPPGVLKRPLWRHQALAVGAVEARWGAGRPGVLWAMAMGTGKSAAAAAVISRHPGRVLILCPRSVVRVWPRELAETLHDPPRVVPIEGTAAARIKALESVRAARNVVVVANYEATRSQAIYSALRAGDWDMLILDESHRMKSPTGSDSRHVWMIAEAIPRRLALTGTPMPHSPLDAFAQARILDPAVLGTAVTAFKQRYAILGGYGGKEIVSWRGVDELAGKLAQLTFSVDSDVLDLPPLHHINVDVELSAPEAKAYRDMAAEGIIHLLETGADVDPGIVTSSTILAEMIRLAQITGGATGGVRDAGGESRAEVAVLGTAKRDRLAELVSDAGVGPDNPLIVFCRFRHALDEVESVAAELGLTYGELSGRRRDGIDDEARATEGLSLIGVQYQSGGVGIDLTRAALVVCYDQTWSLGEFDQAMKRAHRPGQAKPVTVWHLLAGYKAKRGDGWVTTIDHRISRAISDRRDFVSSVMTLVRGEEPVDCGKPDME